MVQNAPRYRVYKQQFEMWERKIFAVPQLIETVKFLT